MQALSDTFLAARVFFLFREVPARIPFLSLSLSLSLSRKRETSARNIALGKVTVCFVTLVFCRAFPREIPTDRYRFIRIDLPFVLIVRLEHVSSDRGRRGLLPWDCTFQTKFVTYAEKRPDAAAQRLIVLESL